jgi:hypothetical protein
MRNRKKLTPVFDGQKEDESDLAFMSRRITVFYGKNPIPHEVLSIEDPKQGTKFIILRVGTP